MVTRASVAQVARGHVSLQSLVGNVPVVWANQGGRLGAAPRASKSEPRQCYLPSKRFRICKFYYNGGLPVAVPTICVNLLQRCTLTRNRLFPMNQYGLLIFSDRFRSDYNFFNGCRAWHFVHNFEHAVFDNSSQSSCPSLLF